MKSFSVVAITKRLFFGFIFISLFLLTATLFLSQPAQAIQGDALKCYWQNSGYIKCNLENDLPVVGEAAEFADLIRGQCRSLDGYYDPGLSKAANHAVFYAGDNCNRRWYIHTKNGSSAAVTISSDGASGSYTHNIYDKEKASKSPEDGRCGLSTQPQSGNDISCKLREGTYNGPQWDGAEALLQLIESMEDCTEDAGVLGHFICPIYEWINNAIGNLIGISDSTRDGGTSSNSNGLLIDLMTVPPISATNAGVSSGIYKTWSAMKDIALGLYVVIFLAALFANTLSLGVDSYTIKKTLPRLVAGAIFTQFSFLIVAVLVDISNLVGTVVPSLIIKAGGGGFTFGFQSMIVGPALASMGIIILIVLSLIALISLLVAVFTFLARQLIVFALVIVAPFAFLLWILPNTEKFYKMWWDNLIKVLMMYPIATGLIALALLFSNTIGETDASDALKVFAGLVPVIALILLPKTFKWGGSAFAAIGGWMAAKGAGAQKAAGKAAKSATKAGAKAGYQKALSSNGKLGSAAAFFGGGLTQNRRTAMQAKARSAEIEKAEKLAKGAATLPNGVSRLDHLLRTGNAYQRQAAAAQLMKMGPDGVAKVQSAISDPRLRNDIKISSFANSDAFEKNMHVAWQARGDTSRVSSMTSEQLAVQTPDSARWLSNHMTQDQAQEVLSSRSAEKMSPQTKAIYASIASPTGLTAPTPPMGPPPGPPPTPPSPPTPPPGPPAPPTHPTPPSAGGPPPGTGGPPTAPPPPSPPTPPRPPWAP